jgi:hypothetical protein
MSLFKNPSWRGQVSLRVFVAKPALGRRREERDHLESNQRMSHQPNLFSSQAPGNLPPQAVSSAPQSGKTPRRTPRWLQRLDLFVRVIVRLYLGLIILVLPWLHMWDENRLLVIIPQLAPLALNGIARGLVSGLGLLNIWIAVHDAIHYKEG